jgi:reactive chlorine resistance protein C
MAQQITHNDMSDASMPTTSAPATPRAIAEHLLDRVFTVVERIWAPLLRVSLAVILIWIGALKFANPASIVALLHASPLWSFLATTSFVYLLGVLELVAASFLLTNRAVRYVGLLVVLLFVGTLSIFVTAPAVTFGPPQSFPFLSLAGQFLLKDLGLAAAALATVAHDVRRRHDVGKPTDRAR